MPKNQKGSYKKDKRQSFSSLVRLNKRIAQSGVCSRRDADTLIANGRVTVNGQVVREMGCKIRPSDKVLLDGKILEPDEKLYILLNKPKDVLTTTDDPRGRKTVLDLIKNATKERVFPVGRLDRNTMGLLLLTNDGDLTEKLTHPSYEKKKIYHAILNKNMKPDDLRKLKDGIELDDGPIAADEISYVERKKNEIGVEIHSGRNRIVRRMFAHLGYEVLRLDRVYFAGLTKKDIPRGKWRILNNHEIKRLKSGAYK